MAASSYGPYRVQLAISAELHPEAHCAHEGCTFTASGDSCVDGAKWHVGQTGHEVAVQRVTRSIYRGVERVTRKKANG